MILDLTRVNITRNGETVHEMSYAILVRNHAGDIVVIPCERDANSHTFAVTDVDVSITIDIRDT